MRSLTPLERPRFSLGEDRPAKKKPVKLELVPDNLDSEELMDRRGLDLMREAIPVLFKRALDNNDPYMAFVQLGNAYKYRLENYLEMLNRFLRFIDLLLEKAETGSIGVYREFLIILQDKALAGDFPEATGERVDSEIVSSPDREATAPGIYQDMRFAQVDRELTAAEIEVVSRAFENAVQDKDVFWAYWHLAKAHNLGIPHMKDMAREFAEMVDGELKKDDATLVVAYKERLARLKARALSGNFGNANGY